MKSIASLWEMQPVQSGAKALGAGFVACGAIWAYRKATAVIGGPTDASLKGLISEMPHLESQLTKLWESPDREWIDILGRLEVFRKFAPVEFDEIVAQVCHATDEKQKCYSKRLRATDAFKIRADYQKVIEAVRVLRSIIEHDLISATEDFDEVAVDLNSKVEQAAMDAIQDTA